MGVERGNIRWKGDEEGRCGKGHEIEGDIIENGEMDDACSLPICCTFFTVTQRDNGINACDM